MIAQERKFRDLPLGTRFRYERGGEIYVVLDRCASGLVAEWRGADSNPAVQAIYTAEDSPSRCAELTVFVVE